MEPALFKRTVTRKASRKALTYHRTAVRRGRPAQAMAPRAPRSRRENIHRRRSGVKRESKSHKPLLSLDLGHVSLGGARTTFRSVTTLRSESHYHCGFLGFNNLYFSCSFLPLFVFAFFRSYSAATAIPGHCVGYLRFLPNAKSTGITSYMCVHFVHLTKFKKRATNPHHHWKGSLSKSMRMEFLTKNAPFLI